MSPATLGHKSQSAARDRAGVVRGSELRSRQTKGCVAYIIKAQCIIKELPYTKA